jgi:hypothetical protein
MRKSLQSVLGELERLEKRVGGPQKVIFITVYEDESAEELERRIAEHQIPGDLQPLIVLGRCFAGRPA